MSATAEEQQKLQLAVAKAALSAALSTPGDAKVPTQLVAKFQSLLTSVTSQSSQRNVKECRAWIMENCKTAKQVTAATRFMSAFSATLRIFKERLSLLYVLNDVLYHATNTFSDTKAFVPSATIQYLSALVKSVQSAPNASNETLEKVLKLWSNKRYFNSDEYAQISDKPVKESSRIENEPERTPLVKPSVLGTNGDPHWLLPVSCMLEVMEYSNTYKPIPTMTVKAIRLSDKTDPNLIEFVESFESSIHDWKFREEEGSEGEEFDGEGWNLKFWRNREGREQKRKEEGVQQRAMERIGKIGALSRSNKPEVGRGRSPDRYSYSRSSESKSQSPPSKRRDPSYSRSPPRRKRPQSRSRSPSPKWRWSPPPRTQNQPLPPIGPSTQSQYPPVVAPQYNQQIYSQQYQQPPQPASSGYYRESAVSLENPSSSWNQRGQYPPQQLQSQWPQAPSGPSSQSNTKYPSGSSSDRRGSDYQNRNFR